MHDVCASDAHLCAEDDLDHTLRNSLRPTCLSLSDAPLLRPHNLNVTPLLLLKSYLWLRLPGDHLRLRGPVGAPPPTRMSPSVVQQEI